MTKPRTTTFEDVMCNPFAPAPAAVPSNPTPGAFDASIVTGLLITGNADAGAIVLAARFGRLKVMLFAPGCALAPRMAWRREPGPLSEVVVTVIVAAGSEAHSCITSLAEANLRVHSFQNGFWCPLT